MSRFQFPTHACPSHSRFPAHPPSASATSTTATDSAPLIAHLPRRRPKTPTRTACHVSSTVIRTTRYPPCRHHPGAPSTRAATKKELTTAPAFATRARSRSAAKTAEIEEEEDHSDRLLPPLLCFIGGACISFPSASALQRADSAHAVCSVLRPLATRWSGTRAASANRIGGSCKHRSRAEKPAGVPLQAARRGHRSDVGDPGSGCQSRT